MSLPPSENKPESASSFLGLAPFLRASLAGVDLRPRGQQMLAELPQHDDDANAWMNLSILMFSLGERAMGLDFQQQALGLSRVFRLAASEPPATVRLLMLMVPGDLSANTPLECLLEHGDIELIFYYVTPGDPLAVPVPEHDIVMVGISEADDSLAVLRALEPLLAHWPKPVINAPQHIPSVGRAAASDLLQQVPGLLMPPTLRASRAALQSIASGTCDLAELFQQCNFPIILRPLGSHGGHDLDKMDCAQDIANYLLRVNQTEFYLSPFIDYSGADGQFRKMRVALIDGVPLACHMAVSSHWMIHYINAGMYQEACKRDEETAFMVNFADFVQRHQVALTAIASRTQLDYVCVDCAQTPDGQLLVFEIDHAMVVHAMDWVELFPYKQTHMFKVKNAFRDYLLQRINAPQPHTP